MKTNTALQRKVKIRMIDLGLDKRGGQSRLAKRLGILVSTLNMALTGYRDGESSEQVLRDALDELKNWKH